MLGPVGSLHVEHMARAMHERGHDVTIGGPLWHGESREGLTEQPFPVSVRTWPTARWTRRLLREANPDVVHAHWMPIAALSLLYGASPLVVSGWGSDVFRATPAQRWAWRAVVRQADMIAGSSAALLDELQRLGAPRERTAILNWGVDLTAFSVPTESRQAVRERLGLPAGPLILSPRSSGDVYNADVVVRAFERVAAKREDVSLAVLRAHAEGHGLGRIRFPDRVHLIDEVPYEAMADYYRAADVCVSMATSDSSPRSVWEAMACGCPCVLSDIAWVHELIVDQQHALVVPIDESAAAGAVQRLVDDGALASTIASNARRLVEEHRDREREMDRLEALYDWVVRDGGRRSRFARRLGPIMASVGSLMAVGRRPLRRG